MDEDLKIFSKALRSISQKDLGGALDAISKYTATRPYLMYAEEVNGISEGYRLMLEYYEKGSSDPMRSQMYQDMLGKLTRVVRNMRIDYKRRNVPFYKDTYRKAMNLRKLSVRGIRTKLEGFVGDLAMLQFEADDKRAEKEKTIHSEHHSFLESLFCDIITSDLWTSDYAYSFVDMLLSPTIDSFDVQVIVSGLMLATMNNFDIYKFQTLVSVYGKAKDENVRQRALIGWVFSINNNPMDYYVQWSRLMPLLSSNGVAREIADLQKQVAFCMSADKDYATIQRDIMPTLMNNSNLKITRFGITEREEDKLEDILNPDAQDKAMEDTEDKFRKMMDMQKSGADIYFGGFSQMKRFSFFYSLVNWFCPFSLNHPGLANCVDKLKDSKFLSNLFADGPFCDSDKYSFALAMANVINSLPAGVKEMINHGDTLGTAVSATETNTPAFIRRSALQNLYRFFRLYTWHDVIYNPFTKENSVFVSSPLFRGTAVDGKIEELGNFFVNRHDKDSLEKLVPLKFDGKHLLSDVFCGYYYLDRGLYEKAIDCFSLALELNPDSEKNLAGLAKSYFGDNKYKEAKVIYQKLYDMYPDNKAYALEYSIVLSCLWNASDALKVLYRLDFMYPDSPNVMRVLAWTLMIDKKVGQAEKKYSALLESGKASAEDWLNAGYCSWFSNDINGAVGRFSEFCKIRHKNDEGAVGKSLCRSDVNDCLGSKFMYDKKLLEEIFVKTFLDERLIVELVCRKLGAD